MFSIFEERKQCQLILSHSAAGNPFHMCCDTVTGDRFTPAPSNLTGQHKCKLCPHIPRHSWAQVEVLGGGVCSSGWLCLL